MNSVWVLGTSHNVVNVTIKFRTEIYVIVDECCVNVVKKDFFSRLFD